MALRISLFRNKHPLVSTATLAVWCTLFSILLMDLKTYEGAESWPTVPGKISTSEISEVKKRRGRSSDYRVSLQYQYEVAGVSYTNDKISIMDDNHSSLMIAEEALKKYTQLPQLTIFYSKSDPSTSILEPKAPGHTYIFLIFGAAGAVILAGICAFGWWKKLSSS